MLPTSARVAQEVCEPSIGIQYPMLCSRMGDTWQIGTTSIREDQRITTGLRFVHWCHASPNLQARQNPNNDPTVRVYQHLEDQLAKAGSDTEDILALTPSGRGHEPTQLFLHCRQEGECRDCSQGGRRHGQALHRHSRCVNIPQW